MHWLKCKFKNAVSVSEVLVSLSLSSEGYLTSIPGHWRLSYLNHIVKINMFKCPNIWIKYKYSFVESVLKDGMLFWKAYTCVFRNWMCNFLITFYREVCPWWKSYLLGLLMFASDSRHILRRVMVLFKPLHHTYPPAWSEILFILKWYIYSLKNLSLPWYFSMDFFTKQIRIWPINMMPSNNFQIRFSVISC